MTDAPKPKCTAKDRERGKMATRIETESDSEVAEIRRVFADYHHPTDEHTPARSEYHSGLLDRNDAADLLEAVPEVDHADFHPRRVAEVVRDLPENVRVSVGREETPVVYVWTDRAPLVGGLLRDAAYWHLSLGVVSEMPAESLGDEPCARPHGEWCIVRACWE
jgi:hypothetical protein